jgi:hypothetical protein
LQTPLNGALASPLTAPDPGSPMGKCRSFPATLQEYRRSVVFHVVFQYTLPACSVHFLASCAAALLVSDEFS